MSNGVCTILGLSLFALLLAGYLGQHFLPPPKPTIFGVDLGTTFSCIGSYHAVSGEVDVLPDADGHKCIPSIIAFKDGKVVAGHEAEALRHRNPTNTLYDAKRFIGKSFTTEELSAESSRYPFKLVLDSDGHVQYQIDENIDGTTLIIPEYIGAVILSTLRQTTERNMPGVKVTKVVMAVPAEFDLQQRAATIKAAKMAGLEVLRIINEPTAAALAYGLHTRDGVADIMVIDLGGGTLDVSLLDIQGGMFLTRAMAGNNHLGGQDFNERLWGHLYSEFKLKRNGQPITDVEDLEQLRSLVEEAKLRLTVDQSTNVSLTTRNKDTGPVTHVVHVTRETFEEINSDLFAKILEPVDRILADVEMSPGDVEAIVLVGGSTRIPKVRRIVADYFGRSPDVSIDPELAVVIGVSVQAGILGGAWPLAVSAIEARTVARKIQLL